MYLCMQEQCVNQNKKPSHLKNKNMQEKQANGGGEVVYVDKNGQPIAQGPITAIDFTLSVVRLKD